MMAVVTAVDGRMDMVLGAESDERKRSHNLLVIC